MHLVSPVVFRRSPLATVVVLRSVSNLDLAADDKP